MVPFVISLKELVDLLWLLIASRVLNNVSEFIKVNISVAVFIYNFNELLDIISAVGEAEADERILKFLKSNCASTVGIEWVESVFEFI